MKKLIFFILLSVAGIYYFYFSDKQDSQVQEQTVTQIVRPPVKEIPLDEHLSHGRYAKASEILDKIPQDERNEEWSNKKIETLHGLGQRDEALTLLDKLIKACSATKKPGLLIYKSEILLDQGSREASEKILVNVFNQYPHSEESLKAAFKLKELWKAKINDRSNEKFLPQFNLVLSYILKNSVDDSLHEDCIVTLNKINPRIFSSPIDIAGLLGSHQIKSGQTLDGIAKKYKISSLRIQRINGIKNKNNIRAGQNIKIIYGKISLVVSREKYEMWVFLGDYFFKRYRVGIGKNQQTPEVSTRVSKSRAKKPEYTNPETHESFPFGDKKNNPIGTRWIGLTMGKGYGIHGTWVPDSIGKASSRGCIRMLNADVEELFDYIQQDDSVEIR